MAAKKTTTRVVLHDVHCPFQDDNAVKVALDITKAVQPDEIILLGDIFDCAQISRFGVSADRLNKIQEDIDVGTAFVADCRRAAPKAKIRFQMGNHEDRLTKWAMNNPNMAKLRALEPLYIFGLDKLGKVEIVPYKSHIRILDTILTHGHVVRKKSGATAMANIEAYGFSVHCGHTHRLSRVYCTNGGDILVGTEGGCLCLLEPDYMPEGVADWQHGMTITYETYGNPRLQIDQIEIVDGTAFHNGRVFSA